MTGRATRADAGGAGPRAGAPCEARPTTRRRDALLALAAALGTGGCALPAPGGAESIVQTADGASLSEEVLLNRLRTADVVLLGELHDNPHHHARRAELLAALPGPLSVVAEHLPRGAAPVLARDAAGDALRQALEAAGFDARGWRWPLHEPLFAAVARAGHALSGGNLERDTARRLAREGAVAMPTELRPLVDGAPLQAAARSALEADLLRGHCGHLGPERMPGMVWAQRGRDAAMAATILAALERRRAAGLPGPVVLVAGNGHVRRDYGVPQLLARLRADARLVSVGFLEPQPEAAPRGAPYDIVFTTPPAAREDPCKAFLAPRAAPARRGASP